MLATLWARDGSFDIWVHHLNHQDLIGGGGNLQAHGTELPSHLNARQHQLQMNVVSSFENISCGQIDERQTDRKTDGQTHQ